jgi:hypothetical protein
VDREDILAEMRRTAAENGGQPLGMGRFEIATGIKGSDWGRYWARFGDLQRDAGLQPNRLNTAYTEDHLFLHLITLARELGHYPTSREMLVRRNNDPDFPHRTVYSQRWSKAELVANLLAWCMDKPEYEDIVAMLKPLAEKRPTSSTHDSDTNQDGKSASYGFVYLLRGHPGQYKIGFTNLVDRRVAELGATAAVELELIHEIKTDDPSGVEAYWHKRFNEQRLRGEWFRLTSADVKAFKRWRRIY